MVLGVFLQVFLAAVPAPSPGASAASQPMDPQAFEQMRFFVSACMALLVGATMLAIKKFLYEHLHPELCICGHVGSEHVATFDYDAAGYIAGGTKKVSSCRHCACRKAIASGRRK